MEPLTAVKTSSCILLVISLPAISIVFRFLLLSNVYLSSVIGVLSLCQFARGVSSYCTENCKLAHLGQGFFPSLNTSTLVILVVLKMFLSAKLSFRFSLLLLLFKTHLELLVNMNADCETKQFPSEPTP